MRVAYRRSRFNSTDYGRYIVTRVDYRLTPGGAPTVRYADLQKAVQEGREDGAELSLADVAAAVRRVRQSKGMLLVEGDPDAAARGASSRIRWWMKSRLSRSRRQREAAAAVSAGQGQ